MAYLSNFISFLSVHLGLPPTTPASTANPLRTICVIFAACSLPQDCARTVTHTTLSDMLNLSVVAPAVLTSALLPHCARGSSVLFMGSTLSEQATEGKLSYITAKHALVGLMRATTQDLFGTGVMILTSSSLLLARYSTPAASL
jgi:short-subunit dehydrogenase